MLEQAQALLADSSAHWKESKFVGRPQGQSPFQRILLNNWTIIIQSFSMKYDILYFQE